MNKKGMLVVEAVFLGIGFLMIVAAGFGRPTHIIKRSIEKCVAEGGDSQACKDKVNAWSQDERIDYIRDK